MKTTIQYNLSLTYSETLLTYGYDASETHLKASRFQMDTVGAFKKFKVKTGTGEDECDAYDGIKIRSNWIEKSTVVDFFMPLHSDVLKIDRLLPDKLSLDINLTREKDSFVLLAPKEAGKNYKIKLLNLALHVRKIQPKASYVAHINKKLDAGDHALYPLTRTVVKCRNIPGGTTNGDLHDVFSGRIPNMIVLGLVKTAAYTGSLIKLKRILFNELINTFIFVGAIDENPFFFGNCGVTSLNLAVNSKNYPAIPYKPRYSENLYMREYRSLSDNINIKYGNSGCAVTPELFHNGCTFYAFDLTPDTCGNFHQHLEDRGKVDVHMTFQAATPQGGLTAIIYASFNDLFELDGDRIVYSTGHAQP